MERFIFKLKDRVSINGNKAKIVGLEGDFEIYVLYDDTRLNDKWYREGGENYNDTQSIGAIKYTSDDDLNISRYADIRHDDIKSLFVPDTKLARRLYKNQITRIENGKIYF